MSDAVERRSPAARIGALLFAFAIGALYGAAATIAHRHVLRIGEITVPWGLVAALAGVAALVLAFRLVADRLAAAAAGGGVIVMGALLTLPGPGGSILVPESVVGTIWSIGAPLVVVVIAVWPSLPPRRAAAGPSVADA